MTFDELVTKVEGIQRQIYNLATRQSNRSADADSGISEAKAKTEEIKRENENNMSDGWNAKVFYHKDDYCLYNNTLWVAKFDNIGVEPSDGTYWDRKNLSDAIAVLGESVADGKAQIASAITDKGVETSADSEFKVMANNIESIITNPEITIDDLSDELLSEIYNSITVDDIPEDIKATIINSGDGKKIYAHKSDSTCQALINAMLLYKKNNSLIESIPNDLTQNEYATLSTLGMICTRINSGASYSTAMSETKISNILYRAASCVKYWIDGYTPDDDCRVNFNQLTIELTECACYAKRVGMNLAWVNNFDV